MGYWYHLGTTAGHGVFFRVWRGSHRPALVFFFFSRSATVPGLFYLDMY